ncbi:MAG: hypothetical protein EOO81_10595, partial [Oxalobacteraceae bacterium]
MTSINIEQNKPEHLSWLRAQRLYYRQAKWVMTAFVFIAIALPILGLVVSASGLPEAELDRWKAKLTFMSITVLLAEIGIFSRLQRELVKKAAKIQELFDTTVLGLPWSKFVVGAKVDAEDIKTISMSELTPTDKKAFLNWYEPSVGTLPIELGRLICQRTNITYDMQVRRLYAKSLLGLVIVMVVVLSVIGLYKGSSFSDLLQ